MITFLAVLGIATLLDPCFGSTSCAGSDVRRLDADSPRLVAVPHDAVPGYVVTSVAFIGQNLEIQYDCSSYANVTGRLDILPNGDLIVLATVYDLIGKDVRLYVRSTFDTESWIDALDLRIRNGNQMVRFTHQAYYGHLPENSPSMSVVQGLDNLVALIPDANTIPLRYAIIDGPAELFEVETAIDGRGQIRSRVPLDYEVEPQYMLLIAAGVEGGIWEPAVAKLWVNVDNVNDNAPVMDSPVYSLVIRRKYSARRNVITIHATDADNDPVIYRIANHEQHFGIHRKNGSIFLRRSGHRLTKDKYELHVFAVDSGGKRSKSSTVHVDVVGRGLRRRTLERVRRESRPLKQIEIPESMIGDILDLDNEYYEVFALKEPAPKFLEVQPMTGTVSLRQGEKFDYESQREVNFTVLITRADDPACELPALILIQIYCYCYTVSILCFYIMSGKLELLVFWHNFDKVQQSFVISGTIHLDI